jgi:hypothetical protein
MLKWFCEPGRHGAQFPRTVRGFQGTHRAKGPRLALSGPRAAAPPPFPGFHFARNHHSDERMLRRAAEPGKPAHRESRLGVFIHERERFWPTDKHRSTRIAPGPLGDVNFLICVHLCLSVGRFLKLQFPDDCALRRCVFDHQRGDVIPNGTALGETIHRLQQSGVQPGGIESRILAQA